MVAGAGYLTRFTSHVLCVVFCPAYRTWFAGKFYFSGHISRKHSLIFICLLLSVSKVSSRYFLIILSLGMGLSLDPNEHQMAIKFWLGIDTSQASPLCELYPEHPLDPLDHHALTCKQGGDAVSRHNKLGDAVLQICHHAFISARAEAGSGLGREALLIFWL